jgi:hypothetical protein
LQVWDPHYKKGELMGIYSSSISNMDTHFRLTLDIYKVIEERSYRNKYGKYESWYVYSRRAVSEDMDDPMGSCTKLLSWIKQNKGSYEDFSDIVVTDESINDVSGKPMINGNNAMVSITIEKPMLSTYFSPGMYKLDFYPGTTYNMFYNFEKMGGVPVRMGATSALDNLALIIYNGAS